MLHDLALILLAFVALYPIVTSAFWIAGGLLFRIIDEANDAEEPPGGWPEVTLLIPAYNEEGVIADCVDAALGADYDELEILVLDDGSSDETVAAAEQASQGDPRVEVIRDPVNRGKADRLNIGFRRARHELVAVCDADTHMHPLAIKLLVSRMSRSSLIATVAGSPHVTNRRTLLAGLQLLEAASIIGLPRRTWALVGRVSVVAGVMGLFRREAVVSVGGYDGRMATEDIDLSWRLLLAGWHTAFEPRASSPRRHGGALDPSVALGPTVPMGSRSGRGPERVHAKGCSLAEPADVAAGGRGLGLARWVLALGLAAAVAVFNEIAGESFSILGFSIGWGIAIAVVAAIQLAFAVAVQHSSDRRGSFAFLLGPLYPIAFWAISAAAALRAEAPSVISGPREEQVAWDVEREASRSAP